MARIALTAAAVSAGALVPFAGTIAAASWIPFTAKGTAAILEATSLALSTGAALIPAKIPGVAPLQDLQVSSSANGASIPFGYGRMRFGGQMIWSPGIKYSTFKQSSKGGQTVSTYIYAASFAVAFGEGPAEILRIWGDSKLIYKGGQVFGVVEPWNPTASYVMDDLVSYRWNPGSGAITEVFQCVLANTATPPPGNNLYWDAAPYPFWDHTTQYYPGNEVIEPGLPTEPPQSAIVWACLQPNIGARPSTNTDKWEAIYQYYTSGGGAPTLYPGDEYQDPDPLIQGAQGVDKTPAFRGLCYGVWESFPLANFGNRVPNLRAEVQFCS